MENENTNVMAKDSNNEESNLKDKKKLFDKKTVLAIIITAIIFLLLKFIAVSIILATRNNATDNTQDLLNYLNSALHAEGNEHKTMYSALIDTHEHGFYPEYISEDLKDKEIMWDIKNDTYVIKTEKDELVYQKNLKIDEAKPYELWEMRNEFPSEKYHSVYLLGTNYRNDIGSVNNPLTVGFDAGNNKLIKNVYYGDNGVKEEVTLRTLNGTLNVNDSLDTINHYGKTDKLEMVNTAFKSLHEFGETTFVEAQNGRYVIEEGSKVNAIHLVYNEEEEGFGDLIFALNPSVDAPTFTRDAVTNDSEMVLLCGIEDTESGETSYIWLYQDGIYPQMLYSNTDNPTEAEDFIDGSDNSDHVKTAAQQLANIYNGPTDENGNPIYKEGQEDDRVLEDNSDVEETGITSEEAQENAENNEGIKATSSSYTSLGLETPYAECYELTDEGIGSSSAYKLDQAYMYRGYSEEEQTLLNKFFDLTDENGVRFFRVGHQEDLKNTEKVEKAFEFYANLYGSDEAEQIRELYYNRYDFLTYRVDYEVTFSKKVAKNSIAFAGQYDANDQFTSLYTWVGFLVNETKANEPIRFLDTAYKLLEKADFHITLAEVLGYVRVFNAGIANLNNENKGTEVTVNLYCYELVDGEETGNKILCNSHTYTLGEVNPENIK